MTILDELAAEAARRVAVAKNTVSTEDIRGKALASAKGNYAFEKALKKPDISFICECKKASPSKGLIAQDFPYLQIAKEYEAAGADCISVLTEPKWFLGSDTYLKEITETVSVPCLRKDFIVDEYMIYEAKLLGASAVLLICSILTGEQMKAYISICDALGMSALTEVHDEAEIDTALQCGARLIGVNNRDLKDFSVNTENSRKLRRYIPENVLFVAESGIKSAEDVQRLREIGTDAVLVGEVLMRAEDKKAKLAELRGLV
ncbi:MAG: indole-3-glycerol phosphate synthase TrpC [Solobacterium sp.]|nr:indole-3-glycerol phosphate synthase TrpC [Solobacterium sp.]